MTGPPSERLSALAGWSIGVILGAVFLMALHAVAEAAPWLRFAVALCLFAAGLLALVILSNDRARR